MAADGKLVQEIRTSVTYHSHHPSFYDEVQIQLPLQLKGLQLRFTFYQLNTQIKKKTERQPPESPIGYATVPFDTPEGGLLPDQVHSLQIKSNVEDSMEISIEASESGKAQKNTFTFSSQLVSTVTSQDEAIRNFFASYNAYSTTKSSEYKGVRKTLLRNRHLTLC